MTNAKTVKNSVKTGIKNKPEPIGKEKGYANLIPGANKNGRPKGKLNFDTRVDMAIEYLAQELVKKHNSDPKNKSKQLKIDDIDIEGDIFAQLINKARSGNDKMIDSFLDRRHGKAKQPIEMSGQNGNPIEMKLVAEENVKKAKAFMAKWTKKPKVAKTKKETKAEEKETTPKPKKKITF